MAEYIEREALMKNFCGYDLTKCVKYGNKDADQRHDSYSTMMMYEIADEIIDAPAADVAPIRHSVWDEYENSAYGGLKEGEAIWWKRRFYRCAICHNGSVIRWRYCPNYGAKMD